MPILGPLDRRTLRKRCLACTRRKIKCEGGSPCVYCLKTKQKCIPQAAALKCDTVFVNTSSAPSAMVDSPSAITQRDSNIQNLILTVSSNVSQDKSTLYVRHFFSGFLVRNELGGPLDFDTIITQFQGSSSLYHVSVALGALDLSKKPYLSTAAELKAARVGALTAYRTSIASFKKDIESNDVQQSDASLWTTFFLGLFELMYDKTGAGFVKHFLYGTSRILQLRGPEAHLTGPGRSFYLTVRIVEICRSLIYSIYSEPTFLSEPSWRELTERIRHDSDVWHPKEDLCDLMISCSSLNHGVWEVLRPDSNHPTNILEDELNALAAEGLNIRAALNDWNISFQQWCNNTCSSTPDPRNLIATTHYHATSIFLSGIFDYHPQFNHVIAPRLPQSHIQHHVDEIISKTDAALKTTNLGGILFFFPLRVAGARVMTTEEASKITEMLHEISERSFVVASAFVGDLKDLWLSKGF